jgi:1,4-dihydroxy-2-naphthoate octaprenyltransferase
VTTASQWAAGARPRTLPLAVGPVLVGTVSASLHAPISWWKAVAAAVVALSLQVGVNYANDYSDGVRGTDVTRHGPPRLVASETATPSAVRAAALSSFAVAAAAGLALAAAVDLRLLALGALCLAGAWLYSGGRRPYGYAGYGEVAVLAFFGFVATAGSAYVQLRTVPAAAWWGSLVAGLPACAVLVANNVRDLDSDEAAGKQTLAVRLGPAASGALFAALLAAAFLAVVPIGLAHKSAFVAFGAVPLAAGPLRALGDRGPRRARALAAGLGLTVRLAFGLDLLLTLGLAVA